MSFLTRFVPDNPVLTKELRVRMRGARAYWILLGYLGFLAALVLFQYHLWSDRVIESGVGAANSSQLGSELFLWIMIPQIFLVLFITPAITSGTLTIEREQQTMDLLTMTRMTRRSIVVGKLLSAVSFTALLIVSSLPLLSICFMLGGIDPGQVFSAYIEMLTASVLIGAMGIMWSSIAKTTTLAVMLTYITLFVVFLFGWFVFVVRISPFGTSAALTAVQGIGQIWFGPNFFGLQGPEGMGFALMCLLAGMLMTAVATVRLEMWPDRKAYILRGLTLLLVGVEMLSLNVWWVSSWYNRGAAAVMVAVQPPIGVLMLSAATLMLMVPIFATGELPSFEARRFARYLLGGWTVSGLRRGKMASGLPFLVLTAVMCLGLYALSFVFVGKATAVTHSGALSLGLPGVPPPAPPQGPAGSTVTVNGQSVMVVASDGTTTTAMQLPDGNTKVTIVSPSRGISTKTVATWPAGVPKLPPPATNVQTPPTGDFVQGAVMLLVCVIGFSLLCMLFSVAFRNRWIAWLLAYVILLLIFVVPEIGGSDAGLHNNLYYFNPLQAFIQMSEPATYWTNRSLLFDQTPMWLVTTWSWALIGGFSFLGMLPFVAREARRNAPIPYEEQVALA